MVEAVARVADVDGDGSWTEPPSGIDFSGFEVPTPDTVAWGSLATVVTLTLQVDPLSRDPLRFRRTYLTGAWSRAAGGMAGRSRRNGGDREFALGFRGLVGVHVSTDPRGPTANLLVTGRCLQGDDARMEELLAGLAERRLAALATGFSRMAGSVREDVVRGRRDGGA